MDELALLADLHLRNPRQGPGGAEQTCLGIELSGLDADRALNIVDVGCGTGACALQLAQHFTRARVVAVDALGAFVDRARERAGEHGLGGRVEVRVGRMESLGFPLGSLDLIWSEGAIYNMGFDSGISAWREFLRPGGVLAVSELIWTTTERPVEIEAYWQREYPGIRESGENERALERAGYEVLGSFVLPESCWETGYYAALERGFKNFLDRHDHHPDAERIVEAEREEIRLYRAFGAWYSYGFYVARRVGDA